MPVSTTLYAVIKSLLTPPGVLALMLLFAFVLAPDTLARILIFLTGSMYLLMTLPVVAILLTLSLEAPPALNEGDIPAQVQAILVLGSGSVVAPEFGGHTVDSHSLARVR